VKLQLSPGSFILFIAIHILNDFSNNRQTYIQRNVAELIRIRDLRLFQNFLSLCATCAGQLLNMKTPANEYRILQPTVKLGCQRLKTRRLPNKLSKYIAGALARSTNQSYVLLIINGKRSIF
jgi:predicted AAA+ superfamily ATPase